MKKISLIVTLIIVGFWAQAQFRVSGKITDENGVPLIGANVQLESTNLGTSTNIDGVYNLLNVPQSETTLSASFLGYDKKSKTVIVKGDLIVDFKLATTSFMADEVVVSSTRLGEKSPGTATLVKKKDLEQQNLGQDLPYLMSITPSFVTTSDAGAGVGYTGFRIRGTDANRINVTVNGIPMNDAESHGVWWVNMPDFASSIENIQIQRGVGTSTNGSGAFGASINMQTNSLQEKSYAEVNSSAGSFNTFKNNVQVGSGLIGNHFVFDARLSKITSDGFVDRASSNLQSYFVSGAYHSKNTLVKINIFSGKEKTYQAWWGVPKVRLENDAAGMQRYEDHGLYTSEETKHMMESNNRTYNYYTYENETDNYQQDHYQLYFNQQLSSKLTFNSALHYTYGRGYYEQYRIDDNLADYGINDIVLGNDTVTSTDLARQKWLDNDFYGIVASLNYKDEKLNATLGGAVNNYNGRHFGNVIWGEMLGNIEKDFEYYRNTGTKFDANLYAKANYSLNAIINLYGDIQYRKITHDISGFDDDNRDLNQEHEFNFFNPKGGVFLNLAGGQQAFIFYAKGHREPNRSNFTDAVEGEVPTYESLNDIEAGYTLKKSRFSVGANAYLMLYKDQLILTGEINDVGSVIMRNVDKSYRRGLEFFGGVKILDNLSWDLNATLSQNKIQNYIEFVDNWDTWGQDEITYNETDIAFSPSIIGNSMLGYSPVKGLKLLLNSQYVGKQYIDNSKSNDRALDAYFVNNINASYTLSLPNISELTFSLMVNNLFNEMYETNAWVYSYNLGGARFAMDGYFPQAGTNFLAGVKVRF